LCHSRSNHVHDLRGCWHPLTVEKALQVQFCNEKKKWNPRSRELGEGHRRRYYRDCVCDVNTSITHIPEAVLDEWSAELDSRKLGFVWAAIAAWNRDLEKNTIILANMFVSEVASFVLCDQAFITKGANVKLVSINLTCTWGEFASEGHVNRLIEWCCHAGTSFC